ncbi:hypothetical protein DPMN_186867 [Dreissena polymorpha]|uniref:Uncharacterized protein n=1 Tax=Dreissena polymorpha TaxID=45954 RepID=A0A9D4DP21_DREPO|nr:hypothetical protein DPMN_186867 [Dreissena polymorpha]
MTIHYSQLINFPQAQHSNYRHYDPHPTCRHYDPQPNYRHCDPQPNYRHYDPSLSYKMQGSKRVTMGRVDLVRYATESANISCL